MDVLELLSREQQGVSTLSELARRLEMPRATCNTVVLALVERGYVTRTAEGERYVIGPACIGLGQAALAGVSASVAQHDIEELAADTGLLAMTTTRSGNEMVATAIATADRPPALAAALGERVPLRPPFGAAFMAWGSAADVSWWLDRAVPELETDERERYVSALNAIRVRGFSVTVHTAVQHDLAATLTDLVDSDASDEIVRHRDDLLRAMVHSDYLCGDLDMAASYHVAQISAPVFDEQRRPLLLVLLIGPADPISADHVLALGERIHIACRHIGAHVGERLPDSLRS